MAANPRVEARTGSRRRVAAATEPYYTVETYSAEDSIGYVIGILRARIAKVLDVEFGRYGFTSAQWPILRAVADGGTPSAADLCRHLSYDTGSMTRMLKRLEDKGFIIRESSEEDRRIVRLRITPAGRKIYPKLRAATIQVLNNLVAGFSASEVEQLQEQLRRMRANLEYVYGDEI